MITIIFLNLLVTQISFKISRQRSIKKGKAAKKDDTEKKRQKHGKEKADTKPSETKGKTGKTKKN